MQQNLIFEQSEGNNWYWRNKAYLNQRRLKSDNLLKIIKLFNIHPKKILDIGCANGFRLAYLNKRYKCECYGIDCSKTAITEGRKRYKNIKLTSGNITKISFKKESFDLIIINFVLHWVDRDLLKKAILEVDRVLKDKGIIILGDFFPLKPYKNIYHYLPNKKIYTYKNHYFRFFEKLGNYQLVGRITGDSSSRKLGFKVEDNCRTSIDILLKNFSLKKL